MTWALGLLAVPTLLMGLVLIRPPPCSPRSGSRCSPPPRPLLALAGVGLGADRVAAGRLGDVADAIPPGVRAFLRDGYRLDAVQHALVVRPIRASPGCVGARDRDIVDAYVRGTVLGSPWAGIAVAPGQAGLATGYVTWLVIGAVAVGLAGVVLA